MTAVRLACATAAIGLLTCRSWGYRSAVAILSLNLTGDTIRAIIAHDWRTLIGLPNRWQFASVSDSKPERF